MSCEGKVAIVTGAAGDGIGRSVALTLAREGVRVVVNYRDSSKSARAIIEHIESRGGAALAVEADIFTTDGCNKLAEAAAQQFGHTDICIIGPGAGWHGEPIDKLSPDAAAQDILQEVTPALRLMRILLPGMYKRKWGRIIAIALLPPYDSPAYSYNVAKAARAQLLLQARDQAWEHGVTVNVLPADLATAEGIDAVVTRINTLDRLDLLVNNAGFGTTKPFVELDLDDHEAIISLHIDAVLHTCYAALPGMQARGRGGIINVSSISAFMATPGSVTYAASKAYLVSFSEGLSTEAAGSGVVVQALCPGFTLTEVHDPVASGQQNGLFNPKRVPGWLWMRPEQVAEASLRAMERGKVGVVVPGLHYRLGTAAARSGLVSPGLVARLKAIFLGGKTP